MIDDDEDKDGDVGAGEFGFEGWRQTPHGRRFFRCLARGMAALAEVPSLIFGCYCCCFRRCCFRFRRYTTSVYGRVALQVVSRRR